MRVGSLFSGIGGFDLGMERAGMTIEWQVEIEPYCLRILNKHWPDVPKFGDIRELSATDLPPVDLLCGGYPCQPFSLAGRRKGAKDDRHLWPEIVRLLQGWRKMGQLPAWCLFENVVGHISMGLDEVLSDLERLGYSCWPIVVPACAVDAPHRRDRVWIVANSKCISDRGKKQCGQTIRPQAFGPASGASGSGDGDRARTVPHPDINPQQRAGAWGERGRETRDDAGRVRQDVANAKGVGCQGRGSDQDGESFGEEARREQLGNGGSQGDVSDSGGPGLPVSEQPGVAGATQRRKQEGATIAEPCWWTPEPGMGRVAHGVPRRVDRLRGLGNAVVPQVVEMIGRAIMAANSWKDSAAQTAL